MKKFILAVRYYRAAKKTFKNSCLIYKRSSGEYDFCLFSEQTISRISDFEIITNKPI